MKNLVLTFIVVLTGLVVVSDARSDVLSEFSDWIEKMETLGGKVNNIEKNLDSLSETIQSLEDKEKTVSKLLSRVEKLEGEEGTAQTLGVIKEGLADLRKLIEDQQVITAVLEKKYQAAQRPLEPLKTAIDEQKQVALTLTARIDAQDQRLNEFMGNIEKKLAPLDALSKNIDEKMGLIAKLTDIVTNIEKGGGGLTKALVVDTGGAPVEAGDTEKPVEKEVKKFSMADVLKAQGYEEVGGSFFVKDLKFKSFGASVEVTGKVMNAADKDYSVANFRVFAYDKSDKLIRNQDFSVKGIKKGNVVSFREIISGVRFSSLGKYAIAFGKNVQSDQVTELKDIPSEKRMEEQKSETKVVDSKTTEMNVAEEQATQGYKDVGNNFYVRNLNLKKFGSSCEIVGELKNLSDIYVSIASFNIKVFDQKKVLIWQQDFSVKGIKANSSKSFSEFLTGVNPSDIYTYEIKSKK